MASSRATLLKEERAASRATASRTIRSDQQLRHTPAYDHPVMGAEIAAQRLYETHDLPDLRTRALLGLPRAGGLCPCGAARGAALQQAPDMWASPRGSGTTAQTARLPLLPTTGVHPPQGLP